MPRKTVNVDWLREKANIYLDADEGLNTPEQRQGVASFLELALHQTGNYRGFRFTHTENAERTPEGGLIDGTYDDTRRYYL